MITTSLTLPVAPPFDFTATALSHGWIDLAPNAWDKERAVLQRVQQLPAGTVVALALAAAGTPDQPAIAVEVTSDQALTAVEAEDLRAAVGRMFRAGEDLSGFYALCQAHGGPWLRATQGLGRVLRSPTVWEDVVKTICTINTLWAVTRCMVRRLAQLYGDPYPADPARHAFPTPQAIAAQPAADFFAAARLGFRGPYVHTLATRIAAGELDLEALVSSSLSTPELRKLLLGIKGIGPYAAASILMYLGRYDGLAVDTAFRAFVGKKYFPGATPTDRELQAIYADWGEWKYLAYWFDIWSEHNPV